MEKLKHFTIPVFVPEKACPFQCIFCDQKKISGHTNMPSPDTARSIIEKHLLTLPSEKSEIEIGFFGGNFTGIPLDEQEAFLKIAYDYLRKGQIHNIRLSTRPDYINTDVLKLLIKYNVKTVELGAQSFDNDVLRKSGRGHKAEDIVFASKMINNAGINLGLQMMIGLPGDTEEKSRYTAQKIIELGAANTRIYPTLVIKGTKLEESYTSGKYIPLTLDEAVDRAKELLLMFEKAGINVIRTGLHPSDGLLNGSDLVAGPFHISFKELVLTRIWKDLFSNLISTGNRTKVEIKVPSGQINYTIGYKASNKKMLEEQFEVVKFKTDNLLTGRQFNVVYY